MGQRLGAWTAGWLGGLWLTGVSIAGAGAGQIDPSLQAAMDAGGAAPLSVLVYLREQVHLAALNDRLDAEQASRAARHESVVLALQATALATQGELLDYLANRQAAGAVRRHESFWIVNAVVVEAPPAEIDALAARPDVGTVFLNYEIESTDAPPNPADAAPLPTPEPDGDPEPNLVAIRAPEVWATGITGAGTLVATLDTGVDGNHPALGTRWRGHDPRYAGNPQWAFFDPVTNETFPFDPSTRGTHMMGVICGGVPGREIGAAPGAEWINAAVIDRVSIPRTVSDAMAAFQWMIDPDGNPATDFDVPHVCANGWGLLTAHGYPPCDQDFWQFLDACESAGIVILFSAGSEGTSGLRRPADRATDDYRTLAVGTIDSHNPSWPIASFSSRGPSQCTPNGASAIKPEMCGPGVNIASAIPGGGYALFTGASSATSHLAGVVALMLEANPDLSVEQTKQILYDTAVDLGPSGDDNTYGHGMIDAVEAVNLAVAVGTLRFEFPAGRPAYINPGGGTTFRVEVVARNLTPQPGTGLLHYDAGGGFVEIAMHEVSPNVYDAVFPELPCGVEIPYYVSVEDTTGVRHTNPFFAPGDAYSGSTTAYDDFWTDDFQRDRGWTVDNANFTVGGWERVVPTPPNRSQEPPGDFDGSGRCFVTGNGANVDVDGGPGYVISPLFDLSDGPDYGIQFALWHATNDPRNDLLTVEASNNGGLSWVTIESREGRSSSWAWTLVDYLVSDHLPLTDEMRFRLGISDNPNNSVTEAGIDAFKLRVPVCPSHSSGDMNCDGAVDAFDVEPFIQALTDPAGYALQYPACNLVQADINGDGAVDAFDIEPFINLLAGP